MGRGRPGGNPNLEQEGMAYRHPMLIEGEKTHPVSVRLPDSIFQKLDKLPGNRGDHLRKALEAYLEICS